MKLNIELSESLAWYSLVKLNQLLTMISHWSFSTQYFKTSMIFPLIFTMVDLENSIDSNSDHSSTLVGLNTSRVESKLFEHGFQDANRSQLEVLLKCEEAIKKNASKVKSITCRIRLANIIAITIFAILAAV